MAAVLGRTLPPEDRSTVLGDLAELYTRRMAVAGRPAADLWYARQCAGFVLRTWSLRKDAGRVPASVRSPFQRRSSLMGAVTDEVADAMRPLRRRKGYAFAVVLTLGVGVAGACAVYTLALWVMLRPVPGVGEPEGLATVLLHDGDPEPGAWTISHADYRELRDRVAPLSELAATAEIGVSVGGLSEVPLHLRAGLVTSNYFKVLRVQAAAGRLFDDAWEHEDLNSVVLSEALARRRFGTAADALGAELAINGAVYTVIGVAGRGFRGHELPATDHLWLNATAAPALLHSPNVLTSSDRQLWNTTIGRLDDRVTTAGFSAALAGAHDLLHRYNQAQASGSNDDLRLMAYPGVGLTPLARASVRRTLRMLGAGATLLLILACANVMNLGLIRATAARGEVAMRRALGAGGGRIARGRLIEGGALGLAGAFVGLGLAVLALRLFSFGAISGVTDSLAEVRLEVRVILFAATVAVLAGCITALLPALLARGVDAGGILRTAHRSHGQGRRTREGLVVAQVGLSAVLAVSAGLLGRTLLNLRAIDIGLDTTNVVSFRVDAGLQGYSRGEVDALLGRLVDRLERAPNVEAAGVVATSPFDGFRIPVALRSPVDPEGMVRARSLQVSNSTPAALGMSLVAGRPLSGAWLDSATERTALINERAVQALFPGATPAEVVGRTLDMARGRPQPARIVGVLRDARIDHVGAEIEPLYVRQWAHGYDVGQISVYVRTRDGVETMRARIATIMREVDPALPPQDIATLDERVARLTQEPRFIASLGGLLTLVASFLAMLGLYTALSQTVLERRHEFAVRAALGARPGTLLRSIASRGTALAFAGLVIGLPAAVVATRILESRLFGVERLDPLVFVVGGLALLVAAAPAALLPARRAARTDPADTLRAQ